MEPDPHPNGGGGRSVEWGAAIALTGLLLLALIIVPRRAAPPTRGALRLPGVVEIQEVRLGSKVGGRVAEVYTAEGALVSPGEPLVRLEAPELEARRKQWSAELASAEAALEKARHGPRPQEIEAAEGAAEAARARWSRLRAGWRPEEIREARHELEAAEADLILARREFTRSARLLERGVAARAEYDTARATLDRAEGRARAARARSEMLEAGSRAEDIAEAAGQLRRDEANLALLKAGTRPEDLAAAEAAVAQARARLAEIDVDLREAVVTAPERAAIEVIAVRRGDLVAPGTPLLRVLRAEDLWVRAYVPETELGRVRLNQPARVAIDAYPGRRFAGRVVRIAGVSEFTPRNVQSAEERRFQVFGIKVRVDDPRGVFKSGMAAEVELPLDGGR